MQIIYRKLFIGYLVSLYFITVPNIIAILKPFALQQLVETAYFTSKLHFFLNTNY